MSNHEIDPGRELDLFAALATRSHKTTLEVGLKERIRQHASFVRAANGDTEALQELRAFVRKEHARARVRRRAEKTNGKRPMNVRMLVPKKERLRETVLARHLARSARRYGGGPAHVIDGAVYQLKPHVMRFRAEYLCGGPVSAESASAILSSPAAAYLPAELFLWEISLPNHRATLRETRYTVDEQGNPYDEPTVEVAQDRDGQVVVETFAHRHSRPMQPATIWVRTNDNIEKLSVYPGTFMDRLRELSDDLARRYGWHQADAAWFLLTDDDPPSPALTASYEVHHSDDHAHALLHLTVQPWLSATTLTHLYKRLQQLVLGEASRARGQRSQVHPIGEGSLKLLDYALIGREKGESWRSLCDRWTVKHPSDARYRGEQGVRNFRRDCLQTKQRVVWLHRPGPRQKEAVPHSVKRKRAARSINAPVKAPPPPPGSGKSAGGRTGRAKRRTT